MKALRVHLALKNPRFRCWDRDKKHSLTVNLESVAGQPASARDLKALQKLAGKEYAALEPLYREFNGITLHRNRDTSGLVVGAVKELPDLEAFFRRALRDPAKFLDDAGCYTRYFDGRTDRQFIPEAFIHD